MRSRCRRSMITTSTSFRPSSALVNTRTPYSCSSPVGSRVRGATTRMSGQPRVFRAIMFERATRECRMSPTMATESLVKSPLCRRMVSMSSMPWVGWPWRPSPPLITATLGLTCSAMKCAAPESLWRTTNMSAAIASRLRRVSVSVSPLLVEEVETLRVMTSADRRWAASSKVVRVRVEFSKNTLHTVLPRSSGTFFTARAPTSRKESAVSRISVSSSRGRPSSERKWHSWPWSLSCSGRLASFGMGQALKFWEVRVRAIRARRLRCAPGSMVRDRAILPVRCGRATGSGRPRRGGSAVRGRSGRPGRPGSRWPGGRSRTVR
ncbi:hypothetical protein D9M70_194490 [compost metagenome]